MRVLVVHFDLHVLAGNVRAMLMLADAMKYLGHDVLFLYTDIRPEVSYYWRPESFKDYHPVRYLDFYPYKYVGKDKGRALIMGDFQRIPHKYAVHQIYDYIVYTGFDYLFTDELSLMGMYDLDVKGSMYIHYPDRPSCPTNIRLWCNSKYIRELIRSMWGLRAEVVYPPLHLEVYDPTPDFKDRDIDVVFFGQFYKVKGFDLAKVLADKGFKVVVIGAKVHNYKPPESENIMIFSNVSVPFYTRVLSRAKVYVHARPGEHFGITIAEAMASGCAVVVHKSGGQWLDVVAKGKYGLGWGELHELIRHVSKLIENPDYWRMWHEKSLQGVRRFSFELIAEKIRKLMR